MIPRLLRASLALLMLGIAVTAAAEWPQWRGKDGLGVAPDTGSLPETWSPDGESIRWRTRIPGAGISSPIVSNGRVFVTTAYEGRWRGLVDGTLRVATVALAGCVALIAWRARRRRKQLDGGGSRWDPRLVLGATLVIALLTALLAIAPDLFLEEGNPGRSWRAGGGLGLLALAAAFGWLRGGSAWRLAAAVSIFGGAAVLAALTPAGPRGPVELTRKVVLSVPALGLALWYVLNYLRTRRAEHPGGAHRPLPLLLLLALAVLVFVPPNFLGGLQRVVVCLDLESGELLWERPVFRAPVEQKYPKSSYATPTPATDGERVYAYFGAGLVAVDFDGRLVWTRRFRDYARHTRYGASSSPLVHGDSVLVLQESEMYQDGPPSWLAAFDRRTGETTWRITPPEARDSYATPLLVPSESTPQIVTPTWRIILGFDADTGEKLWSHEYQGQQVVASFARDGDLVALTGGVYGEKALIVMRVSDDPPGIEEVWRSTRGVARISSPVLYRGLLFTVTDPGIMTCYDAETGKVLWKQRLDGEYYASLVAGDGKVYATNTAGATTVIAAEPEFRKIAVNELGEETYASPALAGGGLLIRTARHLFFIE